MIDEQELREFMDNQNNINALLIKSLQEQSEIIEIQKEAIGEQTNAIQFFFKEIKALKEHPK